ncbi:MULTISPECIES: cysteine desulfurase family protein [unclassified Paenibacillus]|uniref:cysteine desulfurase family protein n=1 Tax=unclassified Paenibacillus TaxID=185978 RepID=UPI001045FE99|nr:MULTISPECIES: cysteine desulfurase family protein [unclassified Paenibacillus]NIK68421.1 cysteine desulfurase [Paenibacillus sp. BK720]TCM99292.1 cysteine desulfurase [Paenibacillus sp. BK033]
MLYFDHCASTPPYAEVVDTFAEVMKAHYANPSSIHRAGVEADKLIARSRSVLAEQFGVKPEEWLFTSGGTESNNLAVKGAVRQFRSRGNHLITTQIEHSSVNDAFRQLEQEGFRVTYLPVSKTGHVELKQLQAAITDETILVSIMHVNNEVGSIQPIEQIGRLLSEYPRILFHVDAVQSIGKLPVKLKEWRIDLLSGSAHKLRGPKGVGYLYVREGLQLQPLQSGGSQERGMRAGTQNVPGIVASAKALRMSMQAEEKNRSRMYALRERLIRRVADIPQLMLNGSEDAAVMAPHIVHFSYPGMKPEVIVHMMEEQGAIISTKSACSSKDNKPSKVLLAMGASSERAAGGIRISFGDEHTEQDIDKLVDMLSKTVMQLKPLERSKS